MRRRFYLFLTLLTTFLITNHITAQKYDPGTGKTVLLIGQTYEDEYKAYVNGIGKAPAGSSHYGTVYWGTIEQGDDGANNEFLDYVRSVQDDNYALVALSIKDNPAAGGFGQMDPTKPDFNSNAIWEACKAIENGKLDDKIKSFAKIMGDRPDVKFYLRIGYEVSMFGFAYKGEETDAQTWLEQQANAGINVFEDPTKVADLDIYAYINAYKRIADIVRAETDNVDLVYHPVRGFNDTKWLYPGDNYVDFFGFSIFNNDVCIECNGVANCEGKEVDPELQKSMDFAKEHGKSIIIAESAFQSTSSQTPPASEFKDYLNRLHNVVVNNDVRVLAYINSDWPAKGWKDGNWTDSRVEVNSTVKSHWVSTFGEGTRYLHSGSTLPDPTCNDGIKNQGETGVDCGGPCPSCTNEPTCDDGIMNGDETGVDCGGSCPNSCGSTGGSCGEFGISYVDDNTMRVYHKDNGWSAQWQYVCVDGGCYSGEKKDGYYYRDFSATLGQQYKIQFKAQDDAISQYISAEETVEFTTDKCSFVGGTEPTCNDGIKNGDETGVDCGGSCPACVTEPTCNDGIKNGDETGVDCGGSCPACEPEPTCTDGIKNGDETGVDCGGSCPNSCGSTSGSCGEFGVSYVDNTTMRVYHKDNGWSAQWQYVCVDGGCYAGEKKDGYYYKDFSATLGQQYKIQFKAQDNDISQYISPEKTVEFTTDKCSFVGGTEPTCNDGIKNGDETDVDCGGSCPACVTEPTCNDGIMNGDETDVDCGGSCPACPEPTCDDGIMNGDEKGVDCGGSCPNICPDDPVAGAKLLPPGQKILFSVGQDLTSVAQYAGKHGQPETDFPEPGAITSYVAFYECATQGGVPYGGLGINTSGDVLDDEVYWDAGPIHTAWSVTGYENSALIIGLNLAEGVWNSDGSIYYWHEQGVRRLAENPTEWQAEIDAIARFCKKYANTAIYIRLGFEFDGNWNIGYFDLNNGDDPVAKKEWYQEAYRNIVDGVRNQGVNNVAWVWQSSASPTDDVIENGHENIQDWYPGDNYVDWVGLSWFLLPNEQPTASSYHTHTQKELADELVQFARSKGKPVMVAESTPQGYDLEAGQNKNISPVWDGDAAQNAVAKTESQIWDEWFTPYFNYIYSNKDVIRCVHYINADWEDQPKFGPPDYNEGYWGDARLQATSSIKNKWNTEMAKDVWMHGSGNLNSQLLAARTKNAENITTAATVQRESKVSVYPNPVNTVLNITGLDKNEYYTVYNFAGKAVFTDNSQVVDIKNLASGMYFLRTGSNDIIKFIKE